MNKLAEALSINLIVQKGVAANTVFIQDFRDLTADDFEVTPHKIEITKRSKNYNTFYEIIGQAYIKLNQGIVKEIISKISEGNRGLLYSLVTYHSNTKDARVYDPRFKIEFKYEEGWDNKQKKDFRQQKIAEMEVMIKEEGKKQIMTTINGILASYKKEMNDINSKYLYYNMKHAIKKDDLELLQHLKSILEFIKDTHYQVELSGRAIMESFCKEKDDTYSYNDPWNNYFNSIREQMGLHIVYKALIEELLKKEKVANHPIAISNPS